MSRLQGNFSQLVRLRLHARHIHREMVICQTPLGGRLKFANTLSLVPTGPTRIAARFLFSTELWIITVILLATL